MSQYDISFNRPFIAGKELYYISQAVFNGHLSGNGPFTKRCERWFEERTGTKRALLTSSCTDALEMAALLADVGPGDEVILPSFTFVSTANAFVLRGARIRFVDIRPDTLNMDESLLARAINDSTKAIVPVHYGGVACEMDAIMELAAPRGVMVIEDAAHAVDSTWRGQHLGTVGQLATYSFHETKNYICGEGGALLVNDPSLVERAEIIREKGTNRERFRRGEVDKYTWVDVGSSFLPSELVAAFLYAQLEEATTITDRRRAIHRYYEEQLRPLADEGRLQLPFVPADCQHNGHLFYVLLPDEETRDGLMAHLKAQGILAVFHYVPLHSSPMGQKVGEVDGELPVTMDISQRLLRLPCYFDLTREDQDRVIEEITRYFEASGR